jgi:mRNA-degrading endonuclease toxin of MazEF toxin-antitoxin module
MYLKDYNSWNIEKQKLEKTAPDIMSFHEREVWWCSIGVNLGDEQDGKNDLFERPVLVLKKFNKKLAWVLPMTSKKKSGQYYEILTYQGQEFSVILSQLRLVSVKRFRRFIRKVAPLQFENIKTKLINLLN